VPVPVPYADLSDPQTLNQYSYVRNIPTSKADIDGHDWPSWSEIGQFIAGAANAYGSDNALGAGRIEQTTPAGKLGAAFGDGVATIQGAHEALEGAAVDIAAIPADTIGVGELAQVVGTAEALHGTATAVIGFTHLSKAASENGGSQPPNPNGSKGAADHQEKVNELVNKAKGEAKAGETVESNKQMKGHDSTRRPDAQIVNAKGKTRKVFEAERRPNSQRNKQREAEYKKLKVKQETHPVN
jgi:hypothetical protein